MPLRDHFHSPVDDRHTWDELHGLWPGVIVQKLFPRLPPRYLAVPRTHFGSSIEVDVGTFEQEEADAAWADANNGNGGVATAVWAPPRPTLTVATDWPVPDEFEVRVSDTK